MKLRIDKLFLYRYRFIIGYSILGLAFILILIILPLIAPGGISSAEMQSAVNSHNVFENFANGNLINLPYHLLQNASINLFGLSIYAIKLPSIILGFATGILLILLLNRWFKTNVALLASIITVLSPIFLFLAGSGTPAILYIFWIILILWLGAKIVGEKSVSPLIFLAFVASVILSIYTPHLIYIAFGIGLVALTRPHIRFAIKKTKIPQLIVALSVIALLIIPLIVACIVRLTTLQEIFFATDPGSYIDNVINAFTPFFSFSAAIESDFLSPLFGLATVTLIIIGIIASMRVLFTSRNTAVSLLVIFAIIISGLNPSAAVIIFIPAAILVAVGLESVLEKWYSLFPTNPYARVFGIFPVAAFVAIIVISGFIYTVFGYHYSPNVAKQFNNDISLINKDLPFGTTLLVPKDTLEYDFYKILETDGRLTVSSVLPDRTSNCIASLGHWGEEVDLKLTTIITSSKSQNSDRLYIYNCSE
ncbi:glycosyltransferase family 39 protein [Candidatus Saccharibacteria bacterium]|nr:glycosyltransferase family 39 protein [Candidatus Saccharibacteria bacterium]